MIPLGKFLLLVFQDCIWCDLSIIIFFELQFPRGGTNVPRGGECPPPAPPKKNPGSRCWVSGGGGEAICTDSRTSYLPPSLPHTKFPPLFSLPLSLTKEQVLYNCRHDLGISIPPSLPTLKLYCIDLTHLPYRWNGTETCLPALLVPVYKFSEG